MSASTPLGTPLAEVAHSQQQQQQQPGCDSTTIAAAAAAAVTNHKNDSNGNVIKKNKNANEVDHEVDEDVLELCGCGEESAVAAALRGARGDGVAAWAHPKTGWTGLHAACKMGRAAVVRLLLARGADPAATTSLGSTPLHIAAAQGHAEAAAVLLERRGGGNSGGGGGTADGGSPGEQPSYVGAADRKGNTALHKAAQQGRLAVARMLVAAGAPLLAENAEGQAPLDVARGSISGPGEHQELSRVLLDAVEEERERARGTAGI